MFQEDATNRKWYGKIEVTDEDYVNINSFSAETQSDTVIDVSN